MQKNPKKKVDTTKRRKGKEKRGEGEGEKKERQIKIFQILKSSSNEKQSEYKD